MTESQLVAGRWVLPTVESNRDGVVRMHVSVSVAEPDALADVAIDVAVSGAGQQLGARETPAPADYSYLQTRAVTAIADFAFDNPGGTDPDTVTVSMQGQSATFAVTVRPPDDDPGPLVA